jgi:hypothetical protein
MRLSKESKAAAVPGISDIGRYVKRATSEPGVRDDVDLALKSIKSAYRRLDRGTSPTAALLNDKKLHRDLRRALRAIRDAAVALTAPPKMRTRDAIALGGALSALLIAATFAFIRGRKLRSQSDPGPSGTADAAESQQPTDAPPAPVPPTPAPPS